LLSTFRLYSTTFEDSTLNELKKLKLTRNYDSTFFLNSFPYIRALSSTSPFKALEELREYEEIAKSKKNEMALSCIYNLYGKVYEYQNKYLYALENYNKAIELTKDDKDNSLTVFAKIDIGNIYYNVGLYKDAIACYTEAYNKCEEILGINEGSAYIKCLALNNISMAYYKLKAYQDAINTSNKSISLALKMVPSQYPFALIYKVRNLGALNKFYEAEETIQKVYNSIPNITKDENKILLINMIQEYYEGIKEYQKVIKYGLYGESFANNSSLFSFSDNIEREINIAKAYYNLNKYNESLNFSIRAFEKAKANDFTKLIKKSSLLISNNFEKQQKLDSATYYFMEYQTAQNKLDLDYVESSLVQETFKNDLLERDIKLKELEESQKYKIYQIIILSTGVVLSIIIAFIIYKRYINKKKLIIYLTEREKQLEELNSAKNKFFSVISHDLKGPISTFHNIIDLITISIEDMDKEEVNDIVKTMVLTNKNVISLLDNLLLWSNSQNGKIQVNYFKMNIKPIVEEAFQLLAQIAEVKNIRLINEINESIEYELDYITFSTAIRNLISNAIKYTNEGGFVRVSCNSFENKLIISVEDNGLGMTKEKLEKLFKIAESRSTDGTNNEKGTGLGLLIVKEFLNLNNAVINVESEVNKGSKFNIEFAK
jgi:signal transduction histidine kinase